MLRVVSSVSENEYNLRCRARKRMNLNRSLKRMKTTSVGRIPEMIEVTVGDQLTIGRRKET